MTLFEYIQKSNEYEITVWDKDYDVEVYFYKTDYKDPWDKAMNELAKLLTVIGFNKNGVTVNLSDVINNKIHQLKDAGLFIKCELDTIMDDINPILSGYVTEHWLIEFVDVLKENDA